MSVRALFTGIKVGVDFGFGESKSVVTYLYKGKVVPSLEYIARSILRDKYRRRYERRRKK